MRALAMTGIETALMMPSIMSGSLIRDTPPWARMSAGTRSSAITATAPASSAILACSAVTTSMMTPPLSISAIPRLTRAVPVWCSGCSSGMSPILRAAAVQLRDVHALADQHHPGVARGERDHACRLRARSDRSRGGACCRAQVPSMRLPLRNTDTAAVPIGVGELGRVADHVGVGVVRQRPGRTARSRWGGDEPAVRGVLAHPVDVADVLVQLRGPTGTRPACPTACRSR